MLKKIIRTVFALAILLLFLAGCSIRALPSPNTSPSSNPRGEDDRTTDTWSSSFDNKDDKLDFLVKYLNLYSDVEDAEYHIVYHDNSGGLIPGPSDWDIRVALKVAAEDIPLWTEGMKKLIPGQISTDLWDDLKSERFTWNEGELVEYWKRPDSNTWLVVYPETGILLKISSTMYMPTT